MFIDKKNLGGSDFYCTIYNLGIPGNTSEDLMQRVDFEIEQRIDDDYNRIFIFAIGTNDSVFLDKEKRNKVDVRKFKGNIQKLIDIGKKRADHVIFVGLAPADETKTCSDKWIDDKFYMNKYMKEYNEVVESTCRKNKVTFIEIFNQFMKTDYRALLEDGLHPNDKGHEKIFTTVKDFLVKKKMI